MKHELHETFQALRHISPAKLAGAIKTYPYSELLMLQEVTQHAQRHTHSTPSQARDLQRAADVLQKGIMKRLEAAQQLIAKFADTPPEIIALTNSAFVLMSSRDLLEDIKNAYAGSSELHNALTKASANILEAINIDIQQRLYKSAPETIATHYSGQELNAYHQLLKRLVTQIDPQSEIFKVYKIITRKLLEGIRIYRTHISLARTLCQEIFQTSVPSFDAVLSRYTTEELEKAAILFKKTIEILNQDISRRPSILEFATQCQQILDAIPTYLANHKLSMRKASRVLQLAHYIDFLSPERVPENATASLLFCQILFEETKRFLLTQQKHLDVALNVKSLEEAHQKVEDGLRYRQYAIGQLFKEISGLSNADLALVPEKQLGDSNLLLQEIQNLIEDFLQRPGVSPSKPIQEIADLVRGNLRKIHEAILASKPLPKEKKSQPLEFERTLPNLSKFYDEDLLVLIQKALKPESAAQDIDPQKLTSKTFIIPTERLQQYIETFIPIVR